MFKLRIGWVDSSYWDDGNRSTSTTLEFTSLSEVNTFIEKHLKDPYTFSGQEGDVSRTLDPASLHLTEVVSTTHDIYSLPTLKPYGQQKYRDELRTIAKWGGDLKSAEIRSCASLGWSRADFLREWAEAVKSASNDD